MAGSKIKQEKEGGEKTPPTRFTADGRADCKGNFRESRRVKNCGLNYVSRRIGYGLKQIKTTKL